jgi:hypothetical protein
VRVLREIRMHETKSFYQLEKGLRDGRLRNENVLHFPMDDPSHEDRSRSIKAALFPLILRPFSRNASFSAAAVMLS